MAICFNDDLSGFKVSDLIHCPRCKEPLGDNLKVGTECAKEDHLPFLHRSDLIDCAKCKYQATVKMWDLETMEVPKGWQRRIETMPGVSGFGIAFIRWDGLFALMSDQFEEGDHAFINGGWYLHLSASRTTRIPTHEEMREIKDLFIGRNQYAIAVWPPSSMHVNIHNHVLHLYHRIAGHPLPEFSRKTGGGGRTI